MRVTCRRTSTANRPKTAYRAVEELQSRLRGYILANNETRLLSLLHLLGAASLRMDEALCPKDYPHLQCEVEQGIQFARSNLN